MRVALPGRGGAAEDAEGLWFWGTAMGEGGLAFCELLPGLGDAEGSWSELVFLFRGRDDPHSG